MTAWQTTVAAVPAGTAGTRVSAWQTLVAAVQYSRNSTRVTASPTSIAAVLYIPVPVQQVQVRVPDWLTSLAAVQQVVHQAGCLAGQRQ
jgi:hypothetical protein